MASAAILLLLPAPNALPGVQGQVYKAKSHLRTGKVIFEILCCFNRCRSSQTRVKLDLLHWQIELFHQAVRVSDLFINENVETKLNRGSMNGITG